MLEGTHQRVPRAKEPVLNSNYLNPIPAGFDDLPSLLQSAGPFQTEDVDGHLLQSAGPFQTGDVDSLRAGLARSADRHDDLESHLAHL